MLKRLLLSLFAAAWLLAGAPAGAQVSVDSVKAAVSRAAHLQCAAAVPASLTGTTNETTLATCTIPAGAMGLNGGIHIYTTWTVTNSANNKTPRIRLGGIAGTQFMSVAYTTVATVHDFRRIRNRNSVSSQVAGTSFASGVAYGSITAAITTGAVDMSVAQDLVFSGQLALGTETLTLESYEVWIVP